MTSVSQVAVYLPEVEFYSARSGGALATWTYQVYRRLAKSSPAVVLGPETSGGYEIPKLYSVRGSSLCRFFNNGLVGRSFRGWLSPLKRWLRQSYARQAAARLADLNCQVIHVHNDPEAVVPIRRRNPQAIIVLHMNNDHLIEGHIFESASSAVRAADRVAFCSQYVMAGALAKVPGLRRDQCFVIHNGADLPVASNQSADTYKSENGPVILFVGRIVEAKGLHVLLAALPQVLARFPSATLRIVGGVRFGSSEVDPYLECLHKQASPLGDRVEFVGPVAHTEIGRHFQAADVFVCPSLWNDPFPLVNLEAMGAGVPVVAFARGGIPEALGDAGLVVSEAAAVPLAAALIRILADQKLRCELARRGRERVARHFTWDVIAGQWQGRLEQWIGMNSRS